MKKPTIPAELHGVATAPALPGTPAVLYEGERRALVGGKTSRHYNLVPPVGGHTMLDLYFCAIIGGGGLLESAGPEADEESLDELTREVWRLAISAVRTRPVTGPMPEAMPQGPLT